MANSSTSLPFSTSACPFLTVNFLQWDRDQAGVLKGLSPLCLCALAMGLPLCAATWVGIFRLHRRRGTIWSLPIGLLLGSVVLIQIYIHWSGSNLLHEVDVYPSVYLIVTAELGKKWHLDHSRLHTMRSRRSIHLAQRHQRNHFPDRNASSP